MPRVALLAALVLALSACSTAGSTDGAPDASPACTPSAAGRPTLTPPAGTSWFGASVESGLWTPGALDAFDATAGAAPALISWFSDWRTPFPDAEVRAVEARRALPVITWEPLAALRRDPAYAPAQIVAGRHDDYLRAWAREAAAWCRPLFVRLAPEMNGTWSNWSVGKYGTRAADVIGMWRHVVDVARAEGAWNIHWVWSPNIIFVGERVPFAGLYPGDAWVDWVGLDGYNWGGTGSNARWLSPAQVFDASVAALAEVTSRPLMLGEVATGDDAGRKPAWITAYFAWLRTQPRIQAWVWFQVDKETNWRIDSTPAAAAAFRAGLAAPWISSAPVTFSSGGPGASSAASGTPP